MIWKEGSEAEMKAAGEWEVTDPKRDQHVVRHLLDVQNHFAQQSDHHRGRQFPSEGNQEVADRIPLVLGQRAQPIHPVHLQQFGRQNTAKMSTRTHPCPPLFTPGLMPISNPLYFHFQFPSAIANRVQGGVKQCGMLLGIGKEVCVAGQEREHGIAQVAVQCQRSVGFQRLRRIHHRGGTQIRQETLLQKGEKHLLKVKRQFGVAKTAVLALAQAKPGNRCRRRGQGRAAPIACGWASDRAEGPSLDFKEISSRPMSNDK